MKPHLMTILGIGILFAVGCSKTPGPTTAQGVNRPADPVSSPQADERAPEPPGRLVDVGGFNLHLHSNGTGGPAVVLIAGAGDYSFDWSLVQPGVSRFAQACSYDRAGAAWSDLGPTPRTMKQEAHELRLLLTNAGIKPPYVLVGHSVGGLILRVFAGQYPDDVAGAILVDSTHEDTTLMYQGKIVRVRDGATGKPVPPVQTILSSPPKPPTAQDLEQAALNLKLFGPPKTEPPFDKLPPDVQKVRLWARSNPKLAAEADDFWAEELQALHAARARSPCPLGDTPLVVMVGASKTTGSPPPGVSAEQWQRLGDEKKQQKVGLTALSRNRQLVLAEKSGHHIQLDEPELVVEAIRQVVESARRGTNLPATGPGGK